MKIQLLSIMLLTSLNLFADSSQTIHSSASLYYEMKDFSNSKQKSDGVVYGASADIHNNAHEFRIAYEKGDTNTIRSPRLTEDLEVDKIYTKYGYNLNDSFAINLNYMNVLDDNIVPTDGSQAYGMGVSYALNRAIKLNFTQYYADYKIFETYQSDFKIDYKSNFEELKYKITLIGKYINIDKDSTKTTTTFEEKFIANAQDDYTTVGVKFHSHYKSYHFGFGAYIGKRAFAIMNDGFKMQHHAMEFDRTYALGIGKNIGDFVLRYQYVYQRAEELPFDNPNVEVSNSRIILNYKF